jgi:hypothetical protein
MRVSAMECPSCGVEVRGSFRQSLFQLLAEEDQRLLEAYLLADFSIKALAAESGMGYAAIRTRLDKLIAAYQALKDSEEAKKATLEKVASGELTPAEAADRIRRLTDGNP